MCVVVVVCCVFVRSWLWFVSCLLLQFSCFWVVVVARCCALSSAVGLCWLLCVV